MAGRRKRNAGRRKSDQVGGWGHMLLGLAIGLAVALGIYMNDRRPSPATPVAAPAAAVPAPAAPAATAAPEDSAETQPRVNFDFYVMLPNLDVGVYEERRPAPQPIPVPKTLNPGIYILQAGSFSQLEDANRRKAELGLLGIRTDIKQGNANGRTVYRVYTDPLDSRDEVNRITGLLQGAGIEVLAKRISDG